jgi:hypothetical protein
MNLTIENWFTLISLIFVVLGGGFALYQYYKNACLKRAEYLESILKSLRQNARDALYLIECEEYQQIFENYQEWFTKDFFGGSKTEKKVDNLLDNLSYIIYLLQANILSQKEATVLNFELNRVCLSYQIQAYLWNIYHFSKTKRFPCTYLILIDYGIKNNLIQKDFEDKNCSRFIEKKYLPF